MRRTSLVAIPVLALAILSWAATAQAQKSKSASGTVKSVSATSLTMTSGAKDMTFNVDEKTKVIGKGIGTKAAPKGGKLPITEALAAGDKVTISYHDMGGTMHAGTVRVTAKAAPAK